jgi:hypothetical protein
MATKAKRKEIVNVTEEMEVCETKKLTFPVWKVFANEQQIRFNKSECKFEFRWNTGDEWEEMEWEYWLGGDEDNSDRATIINTLTQLLALIKATK